MEPRKRFAPRTEACLGRQVGRHSAPVGTVRGLLVGAADKIAATRALESAIAMQRAFDEWNQGVVGAQGLAPLHVRIGLNAGEPIAEDDPDGRSDLFGTAVNRAARITATAKGGEILVANVVRELAEGKDFLFADRGEANLKGFDEPVRLFVVMWREESE